jgi:predicted phosphodiesterase
VQEQKEPLVTRMRPVLMWIGRIALWSALALAGALLGLRVAGPIERETALGNVTLDVAPSWHGEINAYIPIADWGIRADAFETPLQIRVEPRGVDRQAVLRAASGDAHVLSAAEKDAKDAATAALVRALLYAFGGVVIAGLFSAMVRALLPLRNMRRIMGWALAPMLIGALGIAIVVLRAQETFDPQAFNEPRFYARGEELAQLLQVSEQKASDASKGYQSEVQRTLSGYAAILQTGANLTTPEPTKPDSVLLSDLHGNTLVIEPFARLFGDTTIFFAGDLGQTGTAAEARLLVPRLTSLGRKVVAVSGNHDSTLLMRRLARAGAIVLTDTGRLMPDGRTDGEVVKLIDGLDVAGYPDPLEWHGSHPDDPARVFSFAERPNGNAEYARVQGQVVSWFDSLRRRPDVVMIHENGLAQHLARTIEGRGTDQPPLLILTGHDHKQHVDPHGQALVVDAGTAGAGGLFGVGTQSVGIATLQFDTGRVPPRAIDMIRVDPTSGAAEADRIVPSSRTLCDAELVVCKGEQEPKQPAP